MFTLEDWHLPGGHLNRETTRSIKNQHGPRRPQLWSGFLPPWEPSSYDIGLLCPSRLWGRLKAEAGPGRQHAGPVVCSCAFASGSWVMTGHRCAAGLVWVCLWRSRCKMNAVGVPRTCASEGWQVTSSVLMAS